jgi:hypothetical protein
MEMPTRWPPSPPAAGEEANEEENGFWRLDTFLEDRKVWGKEKSPFADGNDNFFLNNWTKY